MRIKETKVYPYDELSDAAKQKARDEHRRFLGEVWDGEATLEDFQQIAPLLGVTLAKDRKGKPEIHYSGFWSQGDGASFTGEWHAADVQLGKLIEYAPQDLTLRQIADTLARLAVEYPGLWGRVERTSHHYAHERTVGLTQLEQVDAEDHEVEILQRAAVEARLIDALRDLMRWLYRQLEADYEYATGDDAVVESIRANEYEFNAEGGLE